MKEYQLVSRLPVAKFYYQGSHSHPVRRTVLVTENTPKFFRGYELREGSTTRVYKNAPIKSYTKAKIAKVGQCGRRLRKRTPQYLHEEMTLKRHNLAEVVLKGV